MIDARYGPPPSGRRSRRAAGRSRPHRLLDAAAHEGAIECREERPGLRPTRFADEYEVHRRERRRARPHPELLAELVDLRREIGGAQRITDEGQEAPQELPLL